MWIKAGVLREAGSRSSNMALWTVAGLGVAVGLYSSCKWVKYFDRILGVLAQEESDNEIDPLVDDVPCEKLCVDNGIDRLPDDILCDIVSRLQTIDALRTSTLSKRWRIIWTMNDGLILNCISTLSVSKRYHDFVSYEDRHRFLKAVGECLQIYSGRKLKSVFVHCCFLNLYIDYLEQWMQNLVGLDVEELYLGHSCRTCDGKPPVPVAYVFGFKLIDGFNRLKYLDLTSCLVKTNFVHPCNSLVRRDVILLSHELSDILRSCPNLKSVCLERCELPVNVRICGPNVKLETFEIHACYQVQKLEISDTKIVKSVIVFTVK